jgi:poly-beta-1,6-N-acetyl-D-glucosamine synthase
MLDIGYVFFWIPGVILFIFGYPLLFSWWSMLVIPITLIIYGLLRRWQERHVFRRLGVHPKHDTGGFYGYLFAYQALTSSASLQYLTGAARRWSNHAAELERFPEARPVTAQEPARRVPDCCFGLP